MRNVAPLVLPVKPAADRSKTCREDEENFIGGLFLSKRDEGKTVTLCQICPVKLWWESVSVQAVGLPGTIEAMIFRFAVLVDCLAKHRVAKRRTQEKQAPSYLTSAV